MLVLVLVLMSGRAEHKTRQQNKALLERCCTQTQQEPSSQPVSQSGGEQRSSMAINGEKLLLFRSSEHWGNGAIQITRSCDERPVVLDAVAAADTQS